MISVKFICNQVPVQVRTVAKEFFEANESIGKSNEGLVLASVIF